MNPLVGAYTGAWCNHARVAVVQRLVIEADPAADGVVIVRLRHRDRGADFACNRGLRLPLTRALTKQSYLAVFHSHLKKKARVVSFMRKIYKERSHRIHG